MQGYSLLALANDLKTKETGVEKRQIEYFIVEFYDKLGTPTASGDKGGIIVTLGNKRLKHGCTPNNEGDYEAIIYSANNSKFYTGKLLRTVTEKDAELFLEEYGETDDPHLKLILRFPKDPEEQVFDFGEEIHIYLGRPRQQE